MIRKCKSSYKDKVKDMFRTNTRAAWDGVRKLTGMQEKKMCIDVPNTVDFCNHMNKILCKV